MGKIKVSDYLFKQINQLGIKDVFGVPGDFNFNLCTSVLENPSLKWIGCTNELNAGYAADGYARINGYGAVLTTYNVGELSALNAIAGSYAENIPVISIVGWPPSNFIKQNSIVHHTYSKPDYNSPLKIFSNATAAQTVLNETNAKSEIDRILSVLVKEKKPVYIGIPVDVCDVLIDDQGEITHPVSNKENLNKALAATLEMINHSEKPVIIGDSLIESFAAADIFRDFVAKSKFPATTLSMGKGIINENEENFIGTYTGSIDNKNVYQTVKESDCIISVGTIYSDFNTFTPLTFNPKDYVEILGTKVTVAGQEYSDILMKDFLRELENQITPKNIKINKPQSQSKEITPDNEKLNFDYFLPRMEQFFKENDRIFTDTGYLNFSFQTLTFPKNSRLHIQFLWSSIGWATPAVEGAC